MDLFILGVAAFFAGLVDAVVGGGGLIQVPVLFSCFPSASPPTLLGTNKCASIWGTAFAAKRYLKHVRISLAMILPSVVAAFIFAFVGAYVVSFLPAVFLRKFLPFILIFLAVYTFKRKDFGEEHKKLFSPKKEVFFAILASSLIGFYDGFFGPGTGSFLLFLFVRWFGYDFLHASAVAKVLNVACNGAALIWFGYSGNVFWGIAFLMAICSVFGSFSGSHLAIKYGNGFVRKAFLLVVFMLILKTTYDGFFK